MSQATMLPTKESHVEAALHGLMVEFLTPEALLAAIRRTRTAGYRHIDAYTPYAVEGLATELGLKTSRIPSLVLLAGLAGAIVGFGMQYFTMAVDYRFNAGGRPYNSWPAFVPVTFEVMVLVASLAAFVGMLLLNGLPQLWHPVFNVAQFARASQDRFFLCIEATDPLFEPVATRSFLASLEPHGEVIDVPLTGPELPHVSDEQSELIIVSKE